MKSFDQLADEYVEQRESHMLQPGQKLTDLDKLCLRTGYIDGIAAGIKFCTYAMDPTEVGT